MKTILLFILECFLIETLAAQNIVIITNSKTVFLPKDYSNGIPEYFIPEGVIANLSSEHDLTYYLNRSQFLNNTNVLQITNLNQWNSDIKSQFKPDSQNILNWNNKYPIQLAGPVYLKVLPASPSTSTNSWWTASFSIICQPQLIILNQTNASILNPNSSVVIPSNVSGDVEVVLEQSQDGVTWTQCLPGTYNASTVKRFFRLRAVEK